MVAFTTGDHIPADVRLITAVNLEVDESSLTGATTAHRKGIARCPEVTEVGASFVEITLKQRKVRKEREESEILPDIQLSSLPFVPVPSHHVPLNHALKQKEEIRDSPKLGTDKDANFRIKFYRRPPLGPPKRLSR